jgi:hypothetical protein
MKNIFRDPSKTWYEDYGLIILAIIGCVIIASCNGYYWHKDSVLAAKLAPEIDKARALVDTFQPVGAQFHSPRPYVIVYIGGDRKSDFGRGRIGGIINEQFNTLPAAGEIKTLILLKDEEIEHATYQGKDGKPFICYRYRYYLWVFNINTGSLCAYNTLEDPSFPPEYTIGPGPDYYGPRHLYYSELCKWANSVTDQPATNEIH